MFEWVEDGKKKLSGAWDSITDVPGDVYDWAAGGLGNLKDSAIETTSEAVSDLTRSVKEKAGAVAEGALELGFDALTSDFMKKYGYAGAATFLYMTLFKGSGWKTAGLVAGLVGVLFGKFLNPLIEKGLSYAFNRSSGADTTAQTQDHTQDSSHRSTLQTQFSFGRDNNHPAGRPPAATANSTIDIDGPATEPS